MRLTERLRRVFLRWERLGLAGVLVLPFAVASGLGFVWLFERGWLLVFVAASLGFVAMFRGARLGLRLWQDRKSAPAGIGQATTRGAGSAVDDEQERRAPRAAPPDPDWSEAETRAYRRACARVDTRLATPLPWEDMPAEALGVIEAVAADLSDGKRGALDFTLPEALLLIDRVSLRYRDFLRHNVPFSDQLSVRSMWWIWQKRETAQAAWHSGYMVWRGVRLLVNPAVGLLREVERAVTSGLHDRLGERMRRDAQVVLLQEIAQTAVELYSGRLRFSDSELLEMQLESAQRDHGRLAQPDAPVRIVLVGQVSAGKSTLVNALLGTDVSETDMAPTTGTVTVHECVITGTACRLVDTPGLDGSAAAEAALVEEMDHADIVLWVIRANRAARAPDAALMAAFDAHLAREPARRRPPVVAVATAADTLLPGWPYPEHRLPDTEARRLGRAMAAIHDDLGVAWPIPVSAEPPVWNIDTVTRALETAIPEALMVQRNRSRLVAPPPGLNLAQNLRRTARGARAGMRYLGKRLWRRGGKPGP